MDRLMPMLCPLAAALLCAGGCGRGSLYELPPPPPSDQRRSVSLIPGEDERKSERDYLQARAAVIELNALLQSRRFEEALELMSQETLTMLEYVSPRPESQNPALVTLVEGRILVRGQARKIDPAQMLLAGDVSKLEDTLEGVPETETPRRKVLYAVMPEGEPRKIVLIKEGGRWVLHRTSLEGK